MTVKERAAAAKMKAIFGEDSPLASGYPATPSRALALLPQDAMSPRLLGQDEPSSGRTPGAPLLPPPPPAEGEPPEDRFCVAGPLQGDGGIRRSNVPSTAGLSFPQLVHQLEASSLQASLLLNDRLRTLQQRRK
ncbi:unnamed protein product, partial [Polarella glacialis]